MSIGQLFFSFSGRINRAKWWLGTIAIMVAQFVVAIVLGFGIGVSAPDQTAAAAGGSLVAMLVALVFLWPTLAIGAKRLHDRNQSGWWQLIAFVPVIGPIYLLVVLGFLTGDEGANTHGPSPLAIIDEGDLF